MSTDNAWLLKTIEAKSDQLNACDLVGGPIVITVRKVNQVKTDKGDPSFTLDIDGGRQPYKPCKNMRRVIINVWTIGVGWVGRSMRVYCDPETMFGGAKVGGIRISHMSHIDKPVDVPVMWTRGKSSMWHIEPLVMPTESVETRIAKVLAAIEKAATKEQLDKVMDLAKGLYDTLTIEQQAVIDNAKLAKGF